MWRVRARGQVVVRCGYVQEWLPGQRVHGRLGMPRELMCLLAEGRGLCRATVGSVARRKKLAPPMDWVTRLGAKRPANVARFRGLTASQRCRSKRSRCATPPKAEEQNKVPTRR
eukprot:scaffold24447_cov48-Phaeocystis_antarctica.AAC.2